MAPDPAHAPRSVVRTVLGDIDPADLGPTMCHEHLLVDQRAVSFREPPDADARPLASRPVAIDILGWLQWNWMSNLDNLVLDSESEAIEELLHFVRARGRSIIDCTLPGIGRQPEAIARISAATQVNVVMGAGYYVQETHPAHVARWSEDDITREIISEFTDGVGPDRIRAGSIGEIGSSWPLTDDEAKVFRAAGRAQRELGCALTTHPGRHSDSPGEIIELLQSAGASLDRVIIGHIERTTMDIDAQKRIADAGCYVQFDLFGTEITATFPYQEFGIDIPSDAQRLVAIGELVRAGYADRILVSHDVCTKHRTRRYGGLGYDHFLRDIVPWAEKRGMGPEIVTRIVEENPRRAFTIPSGAGTQLGAGDVLD